jgi:LysR family glycine cleavage system transcriptional activator
MARRLPQLTQLRTFEAAARLGSFKAAAGELCVTQTAVSHQIRALETRLGRRLFHRHGTGVRLTSEAAPLAATLTDAFDRVATALAEMDDAAPSGDLHVSVAPFFGNRWLLPRLAKFHAAHPELRVVPHLSFDSVDLAAAGVDAALRYGPGPWKGLEQVEIFRDHLGPVAAPSCLSDADPPLSPAKIAALPRAAARDWAADWHAWFDAAGLAEAEVPEPTLYDSRAFAFDAALTGTAAILADHRLTAADESAGRLMRLHPLRIARPQGIHLVRPMGAPHDIRLEAFADWLRSAAQ